jgi:hypothetical protein
MLIELDARGREEDDLLVIRPSRSRMSRVLTMPGWTQLAVTLAFISLSCPASALVWSTLASLDSAYARVGSYGLQGGHNDVQRDQ